MTIAEKLEMYREKKSFVDGVSLVFEQNPKYHTVVSIQYEVYKKEIGDRTCFEEWIVVHFKGGGKSPRLVIGNSNVANFRVIGTLIDGGYYDEVNHYEDLVESSDYELVELGGSKLNTLLSKPMKHISDVRKCFSYCANIDDVERVIKMIPSAFGTFQAYVNKEEKTFRIVNEYCEYDDFQTEVEDYDFYEGD